jgi:hypothetical protein
LGQIATSRQKQRQQGKPGEAAPLHSITQVASSVRKLSTMNMRR